MAGDGADGKPPDEPDPELPPPPPQDASLLATTRPTMSSTVANTAAAAPQRDRTLAPWNAAWFQTQPDSRDPVFFHFHGFRIVSSTRMLWYRGYEVGSRARRYYEQYTDAMRSEIIEIAKRWGEYPVLREPQVD